MLWLSLLLESVGYRFGVGGDSSSGGLLTFSHPESSWTDTRRDQIAFGFRTGQANAVLISWTTDDDNDDDDDDGRGGGGGCSGGDHDDLSINQITFTQRSVVSVTVLISLASGTSTDYIDVELVRTTSSSSSSRGMHLTGA